MTAGDGYRYYTHEASMKALPKRKGNQMTLTKKIGYATPQ